MQNIEIFVGTIFIDQTTDLLSVNELMPRSFFLKSSKSIIPALLKKTLQ